uniref:Uncharacterized protein n=1 Tax=Anguilla anguilla TaxID=7936 RepID=A0A0E9X9X3_ANGAN
MTVMKRSLCPSFSLWESVSKMAGMGGPA